MHASCCCLAYSSTMKIEAVRAFETSVNVYLTTRRHIPDDHNGTNVPSYCRILSYHTVYWITSPQDGASTFSERWLYTFQTTRCHSTVGHSLKLHSVHFVLGARKEIVPSVRTACTRTFRLSAPQTCRRSGRRGTANCSSDAAEPLLD